MPPTLLFSLTRSSAFFVFLSLSLSFSFVLSLITSHDLAPHAIGRTGQTHLMERGEQVGRRKMGSSSRATEEVITFSVHTTKSELTKIDAGRMTAEFVPAEGGLERVSGPHGAAHTRRCGGGTHTSCRTHRFLCCLCLQLVQRHISKCGHTTFGSSGMLMKKVCVCLFCACQKSPHLAFLFEVSPVLVCSVSSLSSWSTRLVCST